ncbi:MAG: bifunctional oligoribonuclease/PAP phosphatase NrnA [Verrucomicrobiales bacterium]|nr:bifunctional oligoribonuclease/PAP phosphatase NrnA [Verrucomicrobiales bacterium]
MSFQSIIGKILDAEAILILCHDRPDGDAIGSALGLGLILEGIGKSIQVVNHDAVPDSLRFLPESSRIDPPEMIRGHDLVVALDSAGRDRINARVWEQVDSAAFLINIDHHISNTDYGDLNHVSSDSPATGQIIYLLAQEAGWPVSQEAATHLYAALSTDTGSFRYPSTSSLTMRIAGELIDAGVDVGKVNQQLYESYPIRRVEVLSLLLQDLSLDFEGRCASVRLPLGASTRLGLGPGDTEGVIDIIRGIDSVIVAVFFEELSDGRIRVSSRSKSTEVSVGDICAHFGGGGHTLAAGARLPGPLQEASEGFLCQVRHVLTQVF